MAGNEAVRAKDVSEWQHRILRRGGRLGGTFSRAVPLLDDQGKMVEWFGPAREVTGRQQAGDEWAG